MISVLVVDDSVVIRRLVTDALSEDPEIRVVGTAPNGEIALAKIAQLRPDLVTLDVEMPVLDGLQTLRAIRRSQPRLPVIMFSTITAAGASATLDALSAGASDYVTKPTNMGSIAESIRSVRDQLIPRIHALCARRNASQPRPLTGPGVRLPGHSLPAGPPRPAGPPPAVSKPGAAALPARPGLRGDRIDIVAIGCSTGGPDALARIIRALPASLPVPVVVVQHMPPMFTKMFAERLDRTANVSVLEAGSELALRAGTVYIAPGDNHLEVLRRGADVFTRLHAGPPENFCRPAVDVLFRSVAKSYGASTLAIVLTGMGQDGKRGSEPLHAAGAEIIVQDEASSVVWGMPGSVVAAGLATAVLPLDVIAGHLIARSARGRAPQPAAVTR